jgi:hypothetical protein
VRIGAEVEFAPDGWGLRTAPPLGDCRGQLAARGDLEFLEHVTQVSLHCAAGHEQAVPDLRAGQAFGHKVDHSGFGKGQAVPARPGSVSGSARAASPRSRPRHRSAAAVNDGT